MPVGSGRRAGLPKDRRLTSDSYGLIGHGNLQDQISAITHQMNAHHRQMIRYSLQHMQFLEQQIIQLDKDIAQKIGESGLETEWELLQSVPGVQANSAATILAETGTAMQQFGDEKHFSSWAGVCPGNNRSAGKDKSSHTTGGDLY